MINNVLDKIKGGLIVSCQARKGWAMYGSNIMASFAVAAKEGGAVGIRTSGKENIEAIKKRVDLPIIGINKVFTDYPVYITPTYESAKEILDLGIDIIALDATDRRRPNNEHFDDIVLKIRENYPNVLIMAEIATLEEAKRVSSKDVDIISTTLSGFTEESKDSKDFDFNLVKEIKNITDLPIVAEGKIKNEIEAALAIKSGAFAVVVGTSITRPEIITARYVKQLSEIDYE